MSFLPISIISYLLGGVSTIVDKTIINNEVKSPLVYTFILGALNFVVIFFMLVGARFTSGDALLFSVLSGVFSALALVAFFQALREFDLLVTSPLVGVLNPLFSLLIGAIFLNQYLTPVQLQAFILLTIGSVVITFNLWWKKHALNTHLLWIIASGFLFALSYVFLKSAFDEGKFLDVLMTSRLAMGFFVLIFIAFKDVRKQIFASKITKNHFANKTSYLILLGQSTGTISGLMLVYAISLANPALVNSMFGVQFVVLLVAALFLSKDHPILLHENLTRKVLAQKILGIIIFTIGLARLTFN